MLIMKTRIQKLLIGAALVGAATLVQAQFSYSDNGDGTCTITGYTGPGGALSIPNSINGLSVVSIGGGAFYTNTSLTSVTIPDSVTSIGGEAFLGCYNLASVTIPNSVRVIPYGAFYDCESLSSVTIPASVTRIYDYAFGSCYNLTAAYFLGNAPISSVWVFYDYISIDPVIVYYLPGTTGWASFWSLVPTQLLNPQASAPHVTGGHFGFNISGPGNTVVVVEACTNLAQPVWLPVSTNALDGSGASSFSDSQSGNYPARFYRFRSP
jgi:hypothetical protein